MRHLPHHPLLRHPKRTPRLHHLMTLIQTVSQRHLHHQDLHQLVVIMIVIGQVKITLPPPHQTRRLDIQVLRGNHLNHPESRLEGKERSLAKGVDGEVGTSCLPIKEEKWRPSIESLNDKTR